MVDTPSIRVTVAGATGFVGKNFLEIASSEWRINALARSLPQEKSGAVNWRQTDLFSLRSSIQALADTDVAIYLVHSMLPSTRLFQGNFSDTDLLIADNFASACVENGVKQIIYLGGLKPVDGSSKHLSSRQEVEEVFQRSGLNCTFLRAGMVAGSGGSSFEMLRLLVSRLPIMVLPRWTQTGTQAIHIDDLTRVLKKSVANPDFFQKTLDVVNGEKITYEDLILKTCAALGKHPLLIKAPINSTEFSKLWVSYLGDTHYELASPLIESLLCELPNLPPDSLIEPMIEHKTFDKMLENILKTAPLKKRRRPKIWDNTVRSIQRLPSRPDLDANEIAEIYKEWLPKLLRGFIRVKSNRRLDTVKFYFSYLPWPLLVLQHVENQKPETDRIKFHIVGGLLCKYPDRGWLEFRQIADKKFTLASINEFVPTLPWYIYRFTQAVVHKMVMLAFARHLRQP